MLVDTYGAEPEPLVPAAYAGQSVCALHGSVATVKSTASIFATVFTKFIRISLHDP